jgi:hypothetical protein
MCGLCPVWPVRDCEQATMSIPTKVSNQESSERRIDYKRKSTAEIALEHSEQQRLGLTEKIKAATLIASRILRRR